MENPERPKPERDLEKDRLSFHEAISTISIEETPTAFDDEPGERHPMGENIKREIPDVASGSIEYTRGQCHDFGIQDFTALSEKEDSHVARFYQDERGLYIFEVPEAHAATVPDPDERMQGSQTISPQPSSPNPR